MLTNFSESINFQILLTQAKITRRFYPYKVLQRRSNHFEKTVKLLFNNKSVTEMMSSAFIQINGDILNELEETNRKYVNRNGKN